MLITISGAVHSSVAPVLVPGPKTPPEHKAKLPEPKPEVLYLTVAKSATSVQLVPFQISVFAVREFPPTGQLYIWNFNYNVGRWNIYIPPSPPTGGINDGSNVGNVGFDQSGGGGPVGAGNNNLGSGNVTSGGGGPVGGGGGDGFIGGV